MEPTIPVLFDTDIGTDIDDAVALAYLLKHPRCELVGITTVTGDVQQRAALAEVVCRAAGREDVPIHCGRRDVLLHGPGQPTVKQYNAIRDLQHRLDRPENTAVGFMRDVIRSRPGEITLLSVGPMSNLALLFSLDPEIPFLCRSIVSMFGRFFSDRNLEWNSECDPVASAITYAQMRPDHVSVGLDVTTKVTMNAQQVSDKFVGEPLSTVKKLAAEWFDHVSLMTFHDPLAAAIVFEPELCTYKRGELTVNPSEDRNLGGWTTFIEGAGSDLVADTVQVDAFFAEFFRWF